MEVFDKELWAGLLSLTALLYFLRWLQARRKVKVYRISPESLERSRDVMRQVLPLIEDNGVDEEASGEIIAASRLPFPKDNVKSAAKILAYYYYKEKRHEELMRVKNCFLALARFQSDDLDEDARERLRKREEHKLTREFECYLTTAPFRTGKAA